MTSASQTLTSHLRALADEPSPVLGVLALLRQKVAELRCQLQGHAPELRLDPGRLSLYCSACRRASPGWQLDSPAPRLRQSGAPDRFARYRWLTASSALQSRAAAGDLVID